MPSLRRILGWTSALAALGAGIATLPAAAVWARWSAEGIALAEQHRTHEVAHPGWSFPAKVQTAPVPLDLPPRRLVAEARARGYVARCPDPGPGEYCEKSGKVHPREGTELEPVVLGWLIGPDAELREHLPLAEAPPHLVDAILAAEDREFRAHGGVNWGAMARAMLRNAQEGAYAQGGSTLTMQVVRNLAQRKEKTAARKLREMALALAVDEHLGKDGVLQMYLDAPYLGQRGSLSICGFRAAARHYFGKDATELTLAEAATLAGILPAPGRLAPDRYPDRARERRDAVLRAMAEHFGYDVTAALAEPVQTVEPPPLPERYPAYLSATRAWLEQNLSPSVVYGAGLTVTVGLDVYAQEQADELFPAKTAYFESLVGRKRTDGRLEAAAVLLDTSTGLIRAIWGGSDVTAISFNRATQARRQPGSSFKPLVYALAFEQKNPDGTPRFTAASTEPNRPRVFRTPQGDWSPRNVGGEYSPTACLAQGLAWSQNIATASLLEDLGGPKPLIAFARKLGFDTSKFKEEMGLALGQAEVTPLEMAQFAATVANGGRAIRGSPVLRAVDAGGTERVGPPQAGEAVMSPETAALTRDLMRLVIEVGTGGAARGAGGEGGYGGPAMGKTGTTDGEKDLWFVGATPRYAMAVWLGYDQPTPLGVAASDLAAPLWGWWMGRVTKYDGPYPEFPAEPRLERRWVCTVSGKPSNGTCKSIGAPFLPGTAPRGACPIAHPPEPPPELDENGQPLSTGHESLWKKLARQRAERERMEAEAASLGITYEELRARRDAARTPSAP